MCVCVCSKLPVMRLGMLLAMRGACQMSIGDQDSSQEALLLEAESREDGNEAPRPRLP